LQLKLIAKLGGDVTRRQLAFGIPPALSSRVSVIIDEAEADVEFPTAVSFERTSANQQTKVEAVLGPSERLELNWTPRVKRAAEIVATVFVQNTALVTIGGGVMNTRAALDYQISQGELKQVRVQVPAGQRLLRVEGEAIRSWEVKDDTLVVDLLKGVSPGYKLTIETEKTVDSFPVTVPVAIPHALDVKRETGLVAARAGEELSLTVDHAVEVQRVDNSEFPGSGQIQNLFSVWRFLNPTFNLALKAETVQPQVEAVVRNNVKISPEKVALSAVLNYELPIATIVSRISGRPPGLWTHSISTVSIDLTLPVSSPTSR